MSFAAHKPLHTMRLSRPLHTIKRKPLLAHWLVYSIPFLTIYWDPIKQIAINDNQFNINFADIGLALVVLSFLAKKRRAIYQKKILAKYGVPTPIMLFLLTWLMALPMVISTSMFFSLSMIASDMLIFAKRIGEYAVIVLLIPKIISFRNIKPIFYMIMISGGIVSAVAIGEAINLRIRAESWLMYSNNLGIYAVVVFNAAVAVLMSPMSHKKERVLSLISAALSFATLILSGSRAASIGIIVSMVFWSFIRWPGRYRRGPTTQIITVSLIALLILFSVGSNFLIRWKEFGAEGANTPQVQARIQASKLGIRLFAHYPLFGTGISGLPQLSLDYFEGPRYWLLEDGLHNAGNQFLQIAVEGGIAAIIIFLIWLIKIRNLVYGHFTEFNDEPLLLLPKYAVKANILALLAAGIGMHTFYVPQIMAIVWLLLGTLYVNKAR